MLKSCVFCLWALIFACLLCCCARQSSVDHVLTYPNHVGDHAFDKDLDDPDFKICDTARVYQYYNFGKGMQYKGEKTAIYAAFGNIAFDKGESGYITLRFIVNCEGKTGWFRMQQMDFDFQEKKFSSATTSKLLDITKSLDGWIIGYANDKPYDYYQYLTFKLQNGNLIGIMP